METLDGQKETERLMNAVYRSRSYGSENSTENTLESNILVDYDTIQSSDPLWKDLEKDRLAIVHKLDNYELIEDNIESERKQANVLSVNDLPFLANVDN